MIVTKQTILLHKFVNYNKKSFITVADERMATWRKKWKKVDEKLWNERERKKFFKNQQLWRKKNGGER